MNAKEAAKLAEQNAAKLAAEAARRRQKGAKAVLKKINDKHQKWFDEHMARIKNRISQYVEYGERKLEYTIDSNIHYNFVSEAYKNFEFMNEAKKIVITLQLEDYKASIDVIEKSEDGSAAYMNSGGECGFEGVRYYKNLEIIVKW